MKLAFIAMVLSGFVAAKSFVVNKEVYAVYIDVTYNKIFKRCCDIPDLVEKIKKKVLNHLNGNLIS